jgi:hypothetical protein
MPAMGHILPLFFILLEETGILVSATLNSTTGLIPK